MNGADLLLIDYLIIALAIVVACLYLFPKTRKWLRGNTNYISVNDLKKTIKADDDILIIDIRMESEYKGIIGYIDESINIPLAEIPNKLNKDAKNFVNLIDTQIIVVGFKNGNDVMLAYKIFKNYGFNNVNILDGGISAWTKKGFATETYK